MLDCSNVSSSVVLADIIAHHRSAAESLRDSAARADELAQEWAEHADPDKRARQRGCETNAGFSRREAAKHEAWADCIATSEASRLSVEGERDAYREYFEADRAVRLVGRLNSTEAQDNRLADAITALERMRSQDPGPHPCGEQPGADVATTAALATRNPSRLPARDLTDGELAVELARVERRWDRLHEPDEDGGVCGHGGSPGEWMVERMDEITTEQSRRLRSPLTGEGSE